ncbi:DisA bacterial checkpoint controller nucleotide-binding protein [Planctomycetes bacterium Pan216]|uniref:DisA bacterial checkpoint controller nucleotide-binding protein n=1 Tax=Kolteria novifilia TaxID=2527975 RepID=A0A518BBT3_9BACT|nr:DisA bacterial checkpoint controller nucleotide-binding protein [Planctomycetes bacterium Pan216]
MNTLTQSMLQHAYAIAQEVDAKALMFDAEAWENPDDLNEALAEVNYRLLLVSRSRPPGSQDSEVIEPPEMNSDRVSVIHIPNVPLTRLAQVKVSMLVGVAEKKLARGDVIVCLSGVQHSNRLDTMVVIRVGDEAEFFLTDESYPLPPDVDPAVFERVLSIASELAVEGRETRTVGATFVVGDSENVLENSRQLVFNPFHGYPEEDCNILSGGLDETIKEFAAIDGAFIIRGDGVVLAAGRYLMGTGKSTEQLRGGLGARHESAASITSVTDAVSITLSQSTSTITIFNSGRVMTEIEKIRVGGEGS